MHINPQLVLIVIGIFMFSLSVGTIIHVFLIDIQYMKQRFNKAKAYTLIIWMVLIAAMLNIPIWWLVYKSFLPP